MKSLIKYSLVLLAAFSLGACGVNESTSTSSTSISTISVSSLPEGSGVSCEVFDSEANKIAEYNTPKKINLSFEFHETLSGSWYMATDNKGNRLPDGTDIYVTSQNVFNLTDKGGYEVENKGGDLPTNAMNTYTAGLHPNTLKQWISNCNSDKQSHEKNPDYMPGYEEKFFLNPLRMYYKITTARVGDGTTVDGTYSCIEEYDVIFRNDGYVDTFTYKKTLEVDGSVRQGMESAEQVKCTYKLLEKCTMQYTFE